MRRILAIVAATLAQAGCGSSGASTPPAPSFVAPLPDGVQDPAVLPTGTAQAVVVCSGGARGQVAIRIV